MNSNDGFQQEDSQKVGDRDRLKILMHPVRTRIVTASSHEPMSVRQLSAVIGLEPSKLYYHVKLLLKAGFLAAAGERRVGNLAETLYLTTAREFVVDPDIMLDREEGADDFEATVLTFMATLRASMLGSYRHTRALNAERAAGGQAPREPESHTFHLSMQALRLDEARAEEFLGRFQALVKEYDDAAGAGQGRPRSYELALAFFTSHETENDDAE